MAFDKEKLDEIKIFENCFNEDLKNLENYLSNLYCFYLSILINKNQIKNVQNLLSKARNICKAYKMDETDAKLTMIEISLELKHNSNFLEKKPYFEA